MNEVRLGECVKVDQWGLRRPRYHATVSEGDVSRIVALACEGRVWARQWGLGLDADGRMAELLCPHHPPPMYAWLGDYHTGIITAEGVRAMRDSIRGSEPCDRYVLGEDGRLNPLN